MAVAPPPYLVSHEDRRLFKRCRRAWDLGSPMRANLEPVDALRPFDLDQSIRDALAIYYFPGMWQWDRAIVYPSVLEAFARSMEAQREARRRHHDLTGAEEREWRELVTLGDAMLQNYFTWAPTVDTFVPAWVGVEFGRGVPDPARPGEELATPDGREVRVSDRIEVLVKDAADVPWLLYHRVVESSWWDLHQLELDERGLFHSWAWELDYLGWTIAGVLYYELRRVAPEVASPADPRAFPAASSPRTAEEVSEPRPPLVPLRAPEGSGPRLAQQGNAFFRRTRIRRSREEVAAAGLQATVEIGEMIDPEVRIYPSPSPESCAACGFREPCSAMYRGEDAASMLETSYRRRPEDAASWRLGSRRLLGRGSIRPPWMRSP
jgi:hypothetical protein